MTQRPLFDPGLQPERTELAWRRTSLSIAIGSLVAMRLLPVALDGVAWMLPGVAGVVFAAVLWVLSERRFRETNTALIEGDGMPLPGARLMLALALFTAAGGAVAVGIVLAHASG